MKVSAKIHELNAPEGSFSVEWYWYSAEVEMTSAPEDTQEDDPSYGPASAGAVPKSGGKLIQLSQAARRSAE